MNFFEPSSRFAELDDEPVTVSTPRSAAQRAASRGNGTRGRGPRTPTGKAKSSLNSTKHSLLARMMAPPSDTRGHDRLYWKVRQELVAELTPKTFTQTVAIDGLASDFIQLIRARQIVESLVQPTALSPQDEVRWDTLKEREYDLRALNNLLASMDNKGGIRCTPADAQRVAQLFADLINRIDADLSEAGTDTDADGPPDPYEGAELNILKEVMATVGPAKPRLVDRGYVADVLRGLKRACKGDATRIQRLATYLVGVTRQWIDGQQDFTRRLERQNDQATKAWALAPEQLLLVNRYLRRIEHAIDRKLQQIRRQ